ncbi:hypothetical protein Fmac_003394 [Flemingia macrophylla]|uniref:Uncharacterized protein n=1 Tax=Flemingia macrophylla TaxID=520843 RepID=A0ABD1NMM7_9FABA
MNGLYNLFTKQHLETIQVPHEARLSLVATFDHNSFHKKQEWESEIFFSQITFDQAR